VNSKTGSPRRKKKNKKKNRINEEKKDDINYNPDSEDSSEFSSIKLKKTKEVSKMTTSEIHSNFEYKISKPIDFELGNASRSGNINLNDDKLMIRFSSEKNFRKQYSEFNHISQKNLDQKEEDDEFFKNVKFDENKDIKIKNTKEMNKLLNKQKNLIKE